MVIMWVWNDRDEGVLFFGGELGIGTGITSLHHQRLLGGRVYWKHVGDIPGSRSGACIVIECILMKFAVLVVREMPRWEKVYRSVLRGEFAIEFLLYIFVFVGVNFHLRFQFGGDRSWSGVFFLLPSRLWLQMSIGVICTKCVRTSEAVSPMSLTPLTHVGFRCKHYITLHVYRKTNTHFRGCMRCSGHAEASLPKIQCRSTPNSTPNWRVLTLRSSAVQSASIGCATPSSWSNPFARDWGREEISLALEFLYDWFVNEWEV